MENISQEELERYKLAFGFFDKEGKGQFSKSDLMDTLTNTLGLKLKPEDLEDILHELSANEQGEITLDGFIEGLIRQKSNRQEFKLGVLLSGLNTDNDGNLATEDWKKAMSKLGIELTDSEMKVVRRIGERLSDESDDDNEVRNEKENEESEVDDNDEDQDEEEDDDDDDDEEEEDEEEEDDDVLVDVDDDEDEEEDEDDDGEETEIEEPQAEVQPTAEHRNE